MCVCICICPHADAQRLGGQGADKNHRCRISSGAAWLRKRWAPGPAQLSPGVLAVG